MIPAGPKHVLEYFQLRCEDPVFMECVKRNWSTTHTSPLGNECVNNVTKTCSMMFGDARKLFDLSHVGCKRFQLLVTCTSLSHWS